MPFTSFKDKELIDSINSLRNTFYERLKGLREHEVVNHVVSTEINHTKFGVWNLKVWLVPGGNPDTSELVLMLHLIINKSLTKERLFLGETIEDVHNYLLRAETTGEWIERIKQSAYSVLEYSGPSRPPRR